MLSIPKRFHFLDALRGLAALTVICFHWNHFWFGTMGVGSRIPDYWPPFYRELFVFYNYGSFGVDFFFTLSGFVFYWKYSQAISRKKITPWKFFLLRFSRLYPLHALTLFLVAGLQYLYFQRHSHYFIYQINDFYHFFLHSIFANKSGLERGYSFNGPTWSVSIEVQLYLLFFSLCFVGVVRKRYMVLIALLGAGLSLPPLMLFHGGGLWSFFIGGLVFYGYQWTVENGKFKEFFSKFLLILPILAVLTVTELYSNVCITLLQKYFGDSLFWKYLKFEEDLTAYFLRKFFITGVLFPAIIYTFALIDTQSSKIGSRISFIGNMSYSSYLLHFPLQIAFVLLLGNDLLLYSLPATFLVFFFVLVVLSLASYKYFEAPVQNVIRRKFL
jgi:peptidoglycan/LPS O-acetylase OafA/YrhL